MDRSTLDRIETYKVEDFGEKGQRIGNGIQRILMAGVVDRKEREGTRSNKIKIKIKT